MKKITFLLITFFMAFGYNGWGQLAAGDIAIIGINTDNADAFGFVALVDVPASTTISFTDNGVFADGSLRTGEGALIWSHTSIVTKGTVVTWENPNWSVGSSTGSNPAFSGSGDQCIAYTGSTSSPTYIFGLNIANSGWVTSGDLSSNTSYLPLGLTEGTSAIHVGSDDNGYYSGLTTGSQSTLQTLVCNNVNWTKSNSRIELSNWPNSFTVSDGGGNQPPAITNIVHTPEFPTSTDAVTISADITDDGTLTTTTLNWGTISGALDQTASMSNGGSGDSYSATIAAQADGVIIYYEVFAEDDESETTTSTQQSYTVDDNPILSGDIIFTEVIQNPNDVTDANGEWFELFNTTAAVIDIDGWTISDNGTDSHVINNSGTLNVPAGGYLILGINSTTSTNGGVPVDYQYSGITLSNGDDELILTSDASVEIDRIEWDGGSSWPDPIGASMTYTGLASEDNNVGSKWITAVARENNYTNPGGSETDKGSPKMNGLFQNLITTTTWTGTGNWSEGNSVGASNWSNGSPGSAVNVTVDGIVIIDLTTSPPAVCNNLDLLSSASATLSVNDGLTVFGDLDVSLGTLTVQSNVSGNGSLIIEGTAAGAATVERYFEGYSEVGSDNGWHNISSPVDNMLISTTDFNPGDDDDLYQWNESSEEWENYKQNHFTNFINGNGYLCAFKTSGTRNFVGTLNTSDFEMLGLAKVVDGFNLLGNPYASALVWNNGDWTLTNVGAVAQIWEETNGSYTPIAADGIIPSTNGFFVEVATSAGGSVTIPSSARTHNATNNYKSVVVSTNEETLDLRLTNDENMYYDVCRVGFKDNATEAWDIEYDAHKLFGGTSTSQLWSVMGDENFVFNYLPYVYESYQLPIYFRAGVDATHHITAEGIESFYGNSGIYLEDLKTGDLVNLSEQQIYTFAASTEDDEARFILHFSGITTVGEDLVAEDVQIYSNGNSVYFRFETMPKDDVQISVFNTIGQEVYAGEVGQSTLSSIRLNEKPGIYIVRLQSEKGTTTQKVMIK